VLKNFLLERRYLLTIPIRNTYL